MQRKPKERLKKKRKNAKKRKLLKKLLLQKPKPKLKLRLLKLQKRPEHFGYQDVNTLNLPQDLIKMITEDVNQEQHQDILVLDGTPTILIKEAISTKECSRRKEKVLETTTTVELQNGVNFGAIQTVLERIGMSVILRMYRLTVNILNHSMLLDVQIRKKCYIQTIIKVVKLKQEVDIHVKIGTLTHLIKEAVATNECTKRKKPILETTITVEVLNGVLCGATLTIQRKAGTDVIL